MKRRPVANREGFGATQLVGLIREIGYNDYDELEYATVTSAPPDLKIKINDMSIELDKDDVIVAQSLTKFSRYVKINGGERVLLEFDDELNVGDRVVVSSMKDGQTYMIIDRFVQYK